MKGLLEKDICLLIHQKQSLLIFFAVCLIMGITTDGSFMVGYTCFLSAILAISTIAYDDADNGMLFLMTLPVERKTYALSKYALGGILCVFGWFVAVACLFVIGRLKGYSLMPEDLGSATAFLPLSVLMLDLMVPLQLKYGTEKSRIVLFILFGAVTAVLFLGKKVFLKGDTGASLLAALDSVPPVGAVAVLLFLFAVLTIISIRSSQKIMDNKTF